MNLVCGEVTQILRKDGVKFGKVRVGRALQQVPLELLAMVECGDIVLVCDGVAISKVDRSAEPEANDVPGDPR